MSDTPTPTYNPNPEARPKAITKRARDALLTYIKAGAALTGRGSRMKLAYLVDPFEKRVMEVFLEPPYQQHARKLVLRDNMSLEQHHVPWGPHATYVFVDSKPHISGIPEHPSVAFRYRQATKGRAPERVWQFYGRGIVGSLNVANGKTAHCSAPHDWLLDTFEFHDYSEGWLPARRWQAEIETVDRLRPFPSLPPNLTT